VIPDKLNGQSDPPARQSTQNPLSTAVFVLHVLSMTGNEKSDLHLILSLKIIATVVKQNAQKSRQNDQDDTQTYLGTGVDEGYAKSRSFDARSEDF
jgi:hypothetical protein